MKVDLRWPAWMKRQTVAIYTDLSPVAVDQYVKRGLLPKPYAVGEALLWSRDEVDKAIRGAPSVDDDYVDPYLAALERAAPCVPEKKE